MFSRIGDAYTLFRRYRPVAVGEEYPLFQLRGRQTRAVWARCSYAMRSPLDLRPLRMVLGECDEGTRLRGCHAAEWKNCPQINRRQRPVSEDGLNCAVRELGGEHPFRSNSEAHVTKYCRAHAFGCVHSRRYRVVAIKNGKRDGEPIRKRSRESKWRSPVAKRSFMVRRARRCGSVSRSPTLLCRYSCCPTESADGARWPTAACKRRSSRRRRTRSIRQSYRPARRRLTRS